MKSSDLLNLTAVLVDEALGSVVESLNRLLGPPVVQIAFLVILPTFIIETVRELVTDHYTDEAVVKTERTLAIEKGRLQNAGGNCCQINMVNKMTLFSF